MPFKYNPPTRKHCQVCEDLAKELPNPIISSENGKASSASSFSIHNWYYFVLGYTPDFPDYVIAKEKITKDHFVVDPFAGAGTTIVECKLKGISAVGLDANDYFYDVVKTKLNWKLNIDTLRKYKETILLNIQSEFKKFIAEIDTTQHSLLESGKSSWKDYAQKVRTEMLTERYISDIPFAKAHIIHKLITQHVSKKEYKSFFELALSSILVPISNVRYGPGFGVSKAKIDVDVLTLYTKKINRMVDELSHLNDRQIQTNSDMILGDARKIQDHFDKNSIDFMITSPPYPGDHEYTKHTRLELIFMNYANTQAEFRDIKKRMIRGSTTNIYKEDNDKELVSHLESIKQVTTLIDKRLKEDCATSGFEKLYTKLVWEYFGGMHKAFTGALEVLKKGGRFYLLVSDSHAFKMVHIQTAKILAEIAIDAGFSKYEIELWQEKNSTSHKYKLLEEILILTK